jgi:VanZ family protein
MRRREFITLVGGAAWLLAVAILVLSLVPPAYRPVTGVPRYVEHFAIFAAAGVCFAATYPTRPWALLIGLPIFSGAVELAQMAVPGRHARLSDFLVGALAACIGAGLGCIAAKFKSSAAQFTALDVCPSPIAHR